MGDAAVNGIAAILKGEAAGSAGTLMGDPSIYWSTIIQRVEPVGLDLARNESLVPDQDVTCDVAYVEVTANLGVEALGPAVFIYEPLELGKVTTAGAVVDAAVAIKADEAAGVADLTQYASGAPLTIACPGVFPASTSPAISFF